MKFHQLRPGARFRYKGAIYRKVSTLTAAGEADQTPKLIPRSGEVALLDERGEAVPERLPDTLSSATVEAALAQFLAACARAAARTDPPLTEAQQAQLAQALNAAGNDLLTQLSAAEHTR